MSIPEKFRQPLLQEFGGYFHVSELPESWDEWMREELEAEAADGAKRMLYWVDSAAVPELVAFLRTESDNRQGSLVREIERWTQVSWSRNDENWKALQRILNAIADRLELREKGSRE